MRGVLVLHPHRAALEPDAVVRVLAAAHNHRHLVRIAALPGAKFLRPAQQPIHVAMFHRNEQMNRIGLLVGKQHVIETVVVQVNEPQAVVVALLVHN